MNYTDLKTNVAGYFNRSDLSSKVEGWIALAESFLFREISPNTIEDSATGTTTGTITLPADFSRLIRLDIDYYGRTVTLDYTTQGDGFVVEGSTIRLVNQPDGSFTYTLYYSPKLTALSSTNTTNWLLDNCYDLYFYATVLEAAKSMKNTQETANVMSFLPTLVESAKGYANRSKFPQSGGLQIKTRVSV